jgi:hypothetical protein
VLRLRATLAAAACVLASSFPAAAAAENPRTATFQATIEGSQELSWNFESPRLDPCHPERLAAGDERLRFRTRRPVRVAAIEVGRRSPLFEITHGHPYLGSVRLKGPARGWVRGGELAGPVDPTCPDQPPATGPTACGTARTTMRFDLSFANRRRLVLRATAGDWRASSPRPGPLGAVLANCPFWTEFGPEYPVGTTSIYDGDTLPAAIRMRQEALFRRTKPRMVLDFRARSCWGDAGLGTCGSATGEFRGVAQTVAKVILTRVRSPRERD